MRSYSLAKLKADQWAAAKKKKAQHTPTPAGAPDGWEHNPGPEGGYVRSSAKSR